MPLALTKYPGGKSTQLKYLYKMFKWTDCSNFIEACAGMGSVSLNLPTDLFKKVYVNDKDLYVHNLWAHFQDISLFGQLKEKLLKTKHTLETYWDARKVYCAGPKKVSMLDIAWATVVSHRMSRNAVPCMVYQRSGRLRGGQNEVINAWESYLKSLDKIHQATQKVEIWREDICDIVEVTNDPNTFIYCVHPKQKVRLKNEKLVKISSIKTGDLLFGDKEVLNVSSKDYKGWMYKIWITGQLDPILLTEDHFVRSTDGNYNKRQDKRSPEKIFQSQKNKKVSDLKEKDYMFIPLGGEEKTYEGILNDVNFYKILGYFAAEGHTQYNFPKKRKKKVPYASVFSFNLLETDTLAKDVAECFYKVFNIKATIAPKSPHKTVTSVRVNSKKISTIIRKYIYGISTNKRLCNKLLIAPKHLQIELLKSWLKGDGGIFNYSRNRIRVTGTSASKKMINQMLLISYRLGLKPNLKKRKNGKFICYDLVYSLHDIKKLGYDVQINRKDVSYKKIYDNHIISPIKKIEKYKYNGKVYDIKVSKDSLFACPYALVHNCDVPYPFSTRACKMYRTEMSDNKHRKLLKLCRESRAKIAISGRPNDIYEYMLHDWHMDVREINNNMSGKKSGRIKQPEVLWTNFEWVN